MLTTEDLDSMERKLSTASKVLEEYDLLKLKKRAAKTYIFGRTYGPVETTAHEALRVVAKVYRQLSLERGARVFEKDLRVEALFKRATEILYCSNEKE